MTTVAELEAARPNLHGMKRCGNPRCGRLLRDDYVKLSTCYDHTLVLLCGACWRMPVEDMADSVYAQSVFALDDKKT